MSLEVSFQTCIIFLLNKKVEVYKYDLHKCNFYYFVRLMTFTSVDLWINI